MRQLILAPILFGLSTVACAQEPSAQPKFEVASVRPSQHEAGPDYNNQITVSPTAFIGRNVTLKRLIADAWHCQLNQVVGPSWLGHNEYDIEARVPDGASIEQIPLMLRSLLSDRFHLKQHSESHAMRVYELTQGAGGLKIQPAQPGDALAPGAGFHFHGDMRQLADLLAVQFSIPAADNPSAPLRADGATIPVLDKTGLEGIYDFNVDIRPELGTDAFTAWKRALDEQLGLKIESRQGEVAVVVVDDVAKMPTEN